jgi:hypothetical protein
LSYIVVYKADYAFCFNENPIFAVIIMLYISPFEVLEISLVDLQEMGKRMLSLKKKQLLAEFELQQTFSITLKDREFTRNDIIALFDQLENEDHIQYHVAIAKDPILLQFLQTGEIETGKRFAANPLYHEPGCIAFVSPFYKAIFQQVVFKRILAANYAYVNTVFSNPILLTGADYDGSFGVLQEYLNERIQAVEQLMERFSTDRTTDLSTLEGYTTHSWVLTLNSLPEAFNNVREHYTAVLYDFSIVLWNAGKRDTARTMLYGIKSINSGPRMTNLVNELSEKLAGELQQTGSSNSSSGGFQWVWGLVMFIVAIVRLGNSCNSDNSDRFNNRYTFTNFNTDNAPAYTMGYPPFSPQTQPDSALIYLLNSLYHSTETNYKNKKHTTFSNGDDPYAALFTGAAFRSNGQDKRKDLGNIPLEQVRIVSDKEVNQQLAEQAGEIGEVTVAPEPKENNRLSAAEKIKAEIERATKSGSTQKRTATLQIANKIPFETILFFTNGKKIFSIYLNSNSSHTLELEAGNYRVMGYGGKNFNYNIGVNSKTAKEKYGSRNLTRVGRFSEINPKMLNCLKPSASLSLTVIPGINEQSEPATITIDFDKEKYFDVTAGKGILSIKSTQIVTRQTEDF